MEAEKKLYDCCLVEEAEQEEDFWDWCLRLKLSLDSVLLGIGDDEPVELLRDKSGKGHKVLAYPLPQFKLELRLNFQKTFEPLCFCPSDEDSNVSGLVSPEVSFLSWFCDVGAGGGGVFGGCGAFGGSCFRGGPPILRLISMGRILPLKKSSSADDESRSKLSRKTQKSKSMLDEEELERTYCSTGTISA